ncbi:MAG: hypothetical protein U5N27_19525 [Rhizobium sp.]|nr:hypothetical protein [Rhizobium sp.]
MSNGAATGSKPFKGKAGDDNGKTALRVHPYLFFTPLPPLPNRSLTRSALNPVSVSTGETDMSDLIFIALGAGTLLVLALYARALDRL